MWKKDKSQYDVGPVWGSFLQLLLLQVAGKARSSPKRGCFSHQRANPEAHFCLATKSTVRGASRAFARPVVRLLPRSFFPSAPTTATPHLPSAPPIAAPPLPSAPLPSPLLRPPPLESSPRRPPPWPPPPCRHRPELPRWPRRPELPPSTVGAAPRSPLWPRRPEFSPTTSMAGAAPSSLHRSGLQIRPSPPLRMGPAPPLTTSPCRPQRQAPPRP